MDKKYTEGQAEKLWNQLEADHMKILDNVEEYAKLTLPHLVIREGYKVGDKMFVPAQSVGAFGVMNLRARLLNALMPASTSFFKYVFDDRRLEAESESKDEIEEFKKHFRNIEKLAVTDIETSNIRESFSQVLEHLIVTGNALLFVPIKGDSEVFPLTSYRCMRDSKGTLLKLIIKESIAPMALPEDVNQMLAEDKRGGTEEVAIYTYIELQQGKYVKFQEINKQLIPGTESSNTRELMPYLALRWEPLNQSSYGLSYIARIIGDLESLEGGEQALNAFKGASTKLLFLLKKTSRIRKGDLAKAGPGDILTGDENDINVFTFGKGGKMNDYNVIAQDNARKESSLARAFLTLNTRNAERVTAREIEADARAASEGILSNFYNSMTNALQRPIMAIMIARTGVKVPKGDDFKPQLITGIDTLNRSSASSKFENITVQIREMGAQPVDYFDMDATIKQLAVNEGFEIDNLLKSEESKAAEQNEAMAKEMAPQIMQGMNANGGMDPNQAQKLVQGMQGQ